MTYKSHIDKYMEMHGFGALCPKAVLFDMDGVCYDSMPYHVMAWQKAMELAGLKMTVEQVYANEGSRGIDTVCKLAEEQLGKKPCLDYATEVYKLKSQIFHDMEPKPPIMPGVLDLMKQIQACGLQIGIVTGSAQVPLLARLMNDFSSFVTPAHLVSALNVDHGKPAPDPYLLGLEKMGGLQPWEALVVENAPLGVESGVAAHIFTIAVNTGPLPDEALTGKGADILFHKMTDLSESWNELFRSIHS